MSYILKDCFMEANDFFAPIDTNDKTHRFVSKSMDIGEEIIAALKRKGMSQRELADRLGCKETLVSRWLGGMQNFTLRTLTNIEEVLEIDLVLTPSKAAEKYKKRPKLVVTQTVVSAEVHAHLRDFNPDANEVSRSVFAASSAKRTKATKDCYDIAVPCYS